MDTLDAIYYPLPPVKLADTVRAKRQNRAALRVIVLLFALAVLVTWVTRVASWGEGSPDAQLLTVVNSADPLPEDFSPQLTALTDGQLIDRRCYDDLNLMMTACSDAGFDACICSAYRTAAKQQELYDNKVQRLINEGVPENTAPLDAAKVVAFPGTSEHQLGLAVDIVDASYPYLDDAQENTPAQRWLMENSWKYGFILRYPEDKCDVTGIIYEPWHYRYVGIDAAAQIHELGVCLEEYVDMFYT